MKLFRRWSVDSAITKLQDPKEKHRLDAAIWVWSRDAGQFSDEERTRLIDVLGVTATATKATWSETRPFPRWSVCRRRVQPISHWVR